MPRHRPSPTSRCSVFATRDFRVDEREGFARLFPSGPAGLSGIERDDETTRRLRAPAGAANRRPRYSAMGSIMSSIRRGTAALRDGAALDAFARVRRTGCPMRATFRSPEPPNYTAGPMAYWHLAAHDEPMRTASISGARAAASFSAGF